MTSIFFLAATDNDEMARSLREGFSSDPSTLWMIVVIAMIPASIAIAWSWWQNRKQFDEQTASAQRVFNALAKELDVSLFNRRLLIRIATQQALPTPLTLLVSPRTMRHHAQSFSHSLGVAGRTRLIRRIARLRRDVFGA